LEVPAQLIWQGILNGLALGGVYILMALGLTLIFGITRIMQFAHGEVYMLGAYVVFYLTKSYGFNLFAAILLSMVAMAILGLFMERFLFRPLQGKILPPIVAATGLIFILQSGALAGFGIYEKSLPRLAEGHFDILGSAVPQSRVVALACAVALIAFLYLFLKRSKYGQAIVGSAQNPQGAVLQGISPNQMSAISMMIACALAAAGGALAGSLFTLSPYMGTVPLVKGLTIIVLGGMGSLLGVVVGGLILGLIDGLVPILAGAALTAILPLIIVILILLIRPQGLFGHE
jgi:branched-chain amino acid transport system permease protein